MEKSTKILLATAALVVAEGAMAAYYSRHGKERIAGILTGIALAQVSATAATVVAANMAKK